MSPSDVRERAWDLEEEEEEEEEEEQRDSRGAPGGQQPRQQQQQQQQRRQQRRQQEEEEEGEEAGGAAWAAVLQSAESGDPDSMHSLALALLTGEGLPVGVAPDRSSGVRWLQRCAVEGYSEAMHLLGRMYESGDASASGFPDLISAAKWYRK